MAEKIFKSKPVKDLLFILWAGGAALLSYSMVYALRKPYTAASFTGHEFLGIDYKVAATTIQILGYLIAKFIGIKVISELKKENRFKFFIGSVVLAELSLIGFGLIHAPYNACVLFINGLSLGCMWGVIFSFIEGRRVTDMLASILGVSIVFSSGFAKSIGLFVVKELHVSEFWMPAVIGGAAIPVLVLMGYLLKALPNPDESDIRHKSERVAIGGKERKQIFKSYMPLLILLFIANFALLVLRDIKEDFLVNIIDMSNQSSWLFARVDSIVTLIVLAFFAGLMFVKSNIRALLVLLGMVILSMCVMCYVSFNHQTLALSPISWLFIQSISLYIAYLTFQTIFFDRFIACFSIKGNVGYFIAMVDFIGYTGTVILLFGKELFQIDGNWFELYNHMAAYVSLGAAVLFGITAILLIKKYRSSRNQPVLATPIVINNQKLATT